MSEIISRIEKHIWDDFKNNDSIGLLTGLSGVAIFYDSIYNVYKDKIYQEKLILIIEKINNLIAEKESLSSLCSGLAGVGWMLLKINNKNIQIDETYFSDLDTILLEDLENQSQNDDYDFLHGSIGIAIYFIERYNNTKNNFIKSIIIRYSKRIISKIENDLESLLLVDDYRGKEKCIYFGLAHGVASVINFLILLSENCKGLVGDITPSLKKCINFLNEYKDFDVESKQVYPNVYFVNSKEVSPARLSWCQGDLGISNSFYNAAQFLNDENLLREAICIINNTRSIKIEESGVADFAICHGAVGILIQYYMFNSKFNIDFSDEIKYWYSILETQTNNFNVFLSFNGVSFENKTDLLSGSSGLGLCLLTLENKINKDWLRCFNLL
jgi:lantibiotic modifying enzyme